MARRAEAVAAALRCLERGERPGIHGVARELGIQPPSVYKHVADAADLERAVALEGFRRLADWLEATPLRGAPRRRLQALVARQRRFAHAQRALYEHMSRVPLDPAAPEVAELTARIFGVFAPLLDAIGVPARDRVHAARALRAAVHGFVSLELSGQFRMDAEVEASFERLCRWLVGGL